MANKNETNFKKLEDQLNQIDKMMDDVFSQTYNSKNTLANSLDNISKSIDDELDHFNISDDSRQIANVTQLYNRINLDLGISSSAGTLDQEIFSNDIFTNNILDSQNQNRYIKIINNEYDTICKYMPKMKTAIELKKDNVLCADNFGKKFISTKCSSVSSEEETAKFNKRCNEIIKKYNLETLFDEMVDDAYTYGEYFLYYVPYKKAFEELIKRKNSNPIFAKTESVFIESGKISDSILKSIDNREMKVDFENVDIGGTAGLKIVLHKTGFIDNIIESHNQMETTIHKLNENFSSVYEMAINEATETNTVSKEVSKNKKFKLDKTIDDTLEYDDISDDGLINNKMKTTINDKIKIEIPGYVLRKLKSESIILLYIEDTCIGYYYIELDQDFVPGNQIVYNGNTQNVYKSNEKNNIDVMMKYLSAKISEHIDKNFIIKNQDISKEIYLMLKYNDMYNVTQQNTRMNIFFIPADDIIHFKFKTNPDTHRGVSCMEKGMMSAKLWICITMCNAIGMMTRGQDKRIYYVKQQVETNVSKSLINVINQLKKGNFGVRQMESVNNMLNILGRFQEHVIPLGPNGDSPVQFEVMPGQDIKVDTDFLSNLEEQAIGSTDVPLELVNAVKSLDYAVHYSMTNARFMKIVYKDQTIAENFFSTIFTRIYNSEYAENKEINVELPPPSFLTYTNGAQFVENVKGYINAIAEVELADETDDELKTAIVKSLFEYYMGSHFEADIFNKIKSTAKLKIESMRNSQKGEQENE